MKHIKIMACEMEGYAVTVNVEGDVKEYAESFLHIFNNVRASKELVKIKNYYGSNEVTVYCEMEAKDGLVRYLKAFGEIQSCEKVLMYQMEEPDYDIDKYYDVVVVEDFE